VDLNKHVVRFLNVPPSEAGQLAQDLVAELARDAPGAEVKVEPAVPGKMSTFGEAVVAAVLLDILKAAVSRVLKKYGKSKKDATIDDRPVDAD
jgi:hypothetical protein